MQGTATERDIVIVAYIDAAGRTVLFRRYGGDERSMPGASAPSTTRCRTPNGW